MAWTKRRRKPRVVWLPPDANSRIGVSPAIAGYQPGAFKMALDLVGPEPGDYVTGLIPLVSDIPSGTFQGTGLPLETLADIYGSGYRLRRIVGKIFASIDQYDGVASGNAPQVLLTCGIIVLRVNPDGTPLLPVASYDQYSPAVINNWADPWVWRRSWVFSNFAEATALQQALYPDTNTQYGSVMDGPHLDQKTARNVLQEERLFFVANAMATETSSAAGNARIEIIGDLRFVASLRRTSGNRGNASR